MKPITPDEVVKQKGEQMPPEVIDEWNKLIAEKWNGSRSFFEQALLVDRLSARMNASPERIRAAGWLDLEELFREVGWSVEYDRPGYNETYPASFTFRR